MEPTVDLNADVGEGFGRWSLGDDGGLMPLITSANVACGFHAGDPTIIRTTCRSAVRHGVAIGAQVSYPDLAGFGRRFIEIDPSELTDVVLYQIAALEGLARVEGGKVDYVKPHGALYNAIVHHDGQAGAVLDALRQHGGDLALVGLPGGVLESLAAEAGVRVVREGFADRGYTDDGRLVPRGRPGSLLTDPEDVAAQTGRLLEAGVDTICVHSDTPGAAVLAAVVRRVLAEAGVTVRPFVP